MPFIVDRPRRALGAATVLLLLVLTGCASAAPEEAASGDEAWSYTSGDGETYTAEATPTRIIAHAYAAKALMEFGIKPVGIYATADRGRRRPPEPRLTGVEVLGEEWGKIDVEKAAALAPDLIVGDWWPVEKAYSGMEDGVEEKSKKLAELAPVVGAAQGDSIVELIEGYEELAESLGADHGPVIDAAAGRVRSGGRCIQGRRAGEARPDGARRSARTRTRTWPCPSTHPSCSTCSVGPGRDRPDDARPRVPLLGDAELRERRHVPAGRAAVRRPQLPGNEETLDDAADRAQASPPTPPARTRPGRPTGCTPTPTTPSSSASSPQASTRLTRTSGTEAPAVAGPPPAQLRRVVAGVLASSACRRAAR